MIRDGQCIYGEEGEKKVGEFPRGKEVTLHIPYNNKNIRVKIQNVKQLARYADVTSPYPDLEMDEAFYELKLVRWLSYISYSGFMVKYCIILGNTCKIFKKIYIY